MLLVGASASCRVRCMCELECTLAALYTKHSNAKGVSLERARAYMYAGTWGLRSVE